MLLGNLKIQTHRCHRHHVILMNSPSKLIGEETGREDCNNTFKEKEAAKLWKGRLPLTMESHDS